MLKEKSFYKEGLPINVVVANIREYPIHFHNDIEVVYVLGGTISLKNGYYTYRLKQGDIFILNDKETHSFYNTGEDNMVMMLQMDLTYFSHYYEDFKNCFFVTDMDDDNDESLEILRGLLARIMMEVLQKGNGYEHKVIESTHNLISCLLTDFRYFAMEDGRFVNEARNKGNKVLAGRLSRITSYMYDNHTRKLTLSEIAENEHLSIYYLSHVIKEATGISFQDLLSFIRVEESEKILLGTNKNTGTIAEACGFSAVRYYIKHFQRWYGMSPMEYRKKFAGKVSSREIAATYEKCTPLEIEEAIKNQVKGIYNAYVSDENPEPVIVHLDIADCMADRKEKQLYLEQLLELDAMKITARPYNLFKNLKEQILFSSKTCIISTAAQNSVNLNNLSILVYNFDDNFVDKLMPSSSKDGLIDLLKNFDDESETLVRCIGISGDFKVSRYKMTKENMISACEECKRPLGPLNKRQAILNSWSTLPNIEFGEISVSDTLNLRVTLRGLSAELILIDRK